MSKDNGLSGLLVCKSIQSLGGIVILGSLAVQISLPNIAYISNLMGSQYSEKLYDYSVHPYVLGGALIGGTLYYIGKKLR